jgi:hypothetical protein
VRGHRRLRFAAPFVIVTSTAACGPATPAEEPAPPVVIEGMDHARNAEWARLDGGVDAPPPTDAAVVLQAGTSMPLVVTLVVPAYIEKPGGYVSCHNFGPQNRGCNPPRPIRHRAERHVRQIRGIERDGDESIVTIALEAGDTIRAGMSVSGRSPSMPARAHIGIVNEVQESTAQLAVRLSDADLRADSELEIRVALDTTASPDVQILTPVFADIINIEPYGGAVIITVAAGYADGIDRNWKLEVIDERDRPVKNGRSAIFKVMQRTSYGKVKLTPDEVKRSPRVRLVPPDAAR